MEVVERGEMIMAGLLVHAPLQRLGEEIPKAWQQLFKQDAELKRIKIAPYLDASLDIIDSKYLQLVGIAVREASSIPRDLVGIHIPAQRLLHHRHAGATATIGETFGAMYFWADQNGLKLSEFKVDMGYTPDGGEKEHDLYIGLWPEAGWHYIEAI